jgi:hypothetical protein
MHPTNNKKQQINFNLSTTLLRSKSWRHFDDTFHLFYLSALGRWRLLALSPTTKISSLRKQVDAVWFAIAATSTVQVRTVAPTPQTRTEIRQLVQMTSFNDPLEVCVNNGASETPKSRASNPSRLCALTFFYYRQIFSQRTSCDLL